MRLYYEYYFCSGGKIKILCLKTFNFLKILVDYIYGPLNFFCFIYLFIFLKINIYTVMIVYVVVFKVKLFYSECTTVVSRSCVLYFDC